MKIAAALIVRNEERCLRRCLESLRGVADEIVVVDTGSTDATQAIAREFTDRIFAIPWQDDFATARNAALNRAEGDCVLAIDADEWVLHPIDARRRLETFAATHSPDTLGSIEIRSALPTVSGPGEAILHAPRFFARGRFRYSGAIHEQLVNSGDTILNSERTIAAESQQRRIKEPRKNNMTSPELAAVARRLRRRSSLGVMPATTESSHYRDQCKSLSCYSCAAPKYGVPRIIESTGVVFGHSGYAQDPNDPAHKSHRNKRILFKEIAQHPNDEYCWFQLGKACFALRAYADAIAAFERALAIIRFAPGAPPMGLHGPVAPDVLADLLATAAYAYANSGQLDKAIDTLEAHRALGHAGVAFADVPHALGYAYLMRGDVPRARAAYEESLQLGPSREQVTGTGSFASQYHLGLLAEAVNDMPRAVAHYLEALRMNPAYRPAIARCLDLTLEHPDFLTDDWRQCVDPSVLTAELEQRQQAKGT